MTSRKPIEWGAPRVAPEVQKYLNVLAAAGAPPIYTLTPQSARLALSVAQQVRVAAPPVDTDDLTIPVDAPGARQVRLRIVRPAGATETLPVVMYFHGGGWMLGDTATHDRLIRGLAVGAHVALVFVDYDRSPEVQYPTANEQAYRAMCYVCQHEAELRMDASRLAVVGDSAGGNMAVTITLMAKERGGPNIAAQVLFYPVTDVNFETDSYYQFADGPWLTKPAMKWFWDAYLPDMERRTEPTACPLRASLSQLRGLPPALVITDENDVLRDEGEAYSHKRAQADVPVTAVRYLGTIHDFLMINAITSSPATRSAIALTVATLRQALCA